MSGDPPEGGVTLRELADRPVSDLHGVGDKKATALAKAGVESVLDLLSYYPRRWLDRTREATIDELAVGEEGMVLVRVVRVSSRRTRNRRSLVEARVTDGTGSLPLTFFNQPWRERQLPEGTEAVVFGRMDRYRDRLQMANPVVDLVGDRTGRIVAVYPQSESAGLASWDLDALVGEAIRRVMKVRGFDDPVPAGVLARHRLTDRAAAYRGIHRPETMHEVAEARRRLVFDELLRIQLALVHRKVQLERSAQGIPHEDGGPGGLVAAFHDLLDFPLTGAQQRVVAEILADMARPTPMHRLLQGDVGSGKTVVAVSALLAAVQGGHQGAFMAPTEVLAEQHHLGVAGLLAGLEVGDDDSLFQRRPVGVALLTNRTTAAERRRIADDLAGGRLDILIGTHALIQEGVEFRSLGAVVIDEQHRFGVEQRDALRRRNPDGTEPDVLVMTATPIPRTAAMTVYGDLDVSVLDELPPGRMPIGTEWVVDDEEAVWAAVRAEVADGHQAYVVCPLIDESEALEVASAEETFERLLDGPLPRRAGGDHRDRGRRRRPKRHGHGRPRRRPLRHRPTAPAARPGRPGGGRESVPAGGGGDHARRRGAAPGDGPNHRRLRTGRGRPRPARRGHDHGGAPEGPERPAPRLAAPRPRVGRGRTGGGRRPGRRRRRPPRPPGTGRRGRPPAR